MSTLRSTGLSGEKALRCCQRAPLAYQLKLSQIFSELLTQSLEVRTRDLWGSVIVATLGGTPARTGSDFERLVRRPFTPGRPAGDFEKLIQKPFRPQPLRVKTIPRGSPLPLGAIVLLGADALSSLVRATATLETLTAALQIISDVEPADECERCIRAAVWRQSRPQQKVRTTIRRRI